MIGSALTVACVWVRGNVPYTAEYVTRLRNGVARALPAVAHRFVCLTDSPRALPEDLETIPIARPRHMAGWWAKVQLFRPGLFTGRVLYLDLDSLVVGGLGAIVDYPAPAALLPDAGTFPGRRGLEVVKRFNSSVMVWDAGALDAVYTDWSPGVTARLWGDQDWIGERMPDAARMPAAWCPRLSTCLAGPPPGARVVLAKVPKNAEAAARLPWFREAWQ